MGVLLPAFFVGFLSWSHLGGLILFVLGSSLIRFRWKEDSGSPSSIRNTLLLAAVLVPVLFFSLLIEKTSCTTVAYFGSNGCLIGEERASGPDRSRWRTVGHGCAGFGRFAIGVSGGCLDAGGLGFRAMS